MSDPADLPGVRLDRSLAGLRASFLGIPGSSDVASTEAEHPAIRPPPAADPAPSVEEAGSAHQSNLLGRAFAIFRQWLPWQR